MKYYISISILLILLTRMTCDGQNLKENIYTKIENIRPCFRRMNSTNMIGCTSEKGGNVGTVIYLENEEDFDKIEENEFAPYIILIDPFIFNSRMLHKFKQSGLVNGVILPTVSDGKWKGHYPREGYSEDGKCPGSFLESGRDPCQDESVWNPSGQSIMWENWNFPIFLVENSTFVENIHQCYLDYNIPLQWPLCSLELKSNMFAADNSQTCLRRSDLFSISPVQVCDPLSDDNIHYFVSPRTSEPEPDRSVLVVAAKMDTLSIFDQVEVGFDSPSSGIVTLLSIAKTVTDAVKQNPLRGGIKNIMFLLIQGESFDHIGSTRLVHDMSLDSFPFNNSDKSISEKYPDGMQPLFPLSSIHSIIEIDQISNINTDNVYIHTKNSPDEIVNSMLGNRDTLSVTEIKDSLPPSSSATFLSNSNNIPSLIVSNYRTQYTNKMYHSIYDNAERAGYNYTAPNTKSDNIVKHLSMVSNMVSAAVLETAGINGVRSNRDQDTLINELLNCYTVTSNCSMFYESSEPDMYPWIYPPAARGKSPFPQYVGVRSSYHTLMTKLVLQKLTGIEFDTKFELTKDITELTDYDILKEGMKQCRELNKNQNIFSYVYVVFDKFCHNVTEVQCGKCLRTTVHKTPALSPIMDDYDNWDQDTTKFPTWTESIWKTIGARMFLRGSQSYDQGIFALGIIVATTSLILTFWFNKYVNVIFQDKTNLAVDNPVPVEM